jgi:SH3-like domain-containing protein
VANSNGATVRCRALPSLDGTILASLAPGTSVEVRGSASGDWLPVRCANTDGYVWAEYVEISGSQPATMLEPNIEQSPDSTSDIVPTTAIATAEPTEVPSPTALPPEVPATTEPTTTPILVTGSGYIASDDGGAVNCRSNPSTDADVITILEHGLWIETRGAPFDGWQGIRCAGVDGFVAEQFISDSPPPIPTDAPVESEPEVPDASDASESIPESAPAGSGPEFGGTLLQPASAWDANGNASVWNAFDGSSGSAWSSVPGAGQASITLDLGQPYVLTGVRWMFSQPGGARDLALQVSMDGESWSHVASSSNRAPGTWEGAWTSATARFVRLVFTNSSGAPALGYVAEIQVWGAPAATKGGPGSDQALVPEVRRLAVTDRGSFDPDSIARRNVSPPKVRWS